MISRSTTALVKPAKSNTTPISTGSIRKRLHAFERGGGRPVRVLLDYELKRNLIAIWLLARKKTTRTGKRESPKSTTSGS